jgi:uncharacterized lipoprotein YmbA
MMRPPLPRLYFAAPLLAAFSALCGCLGAGTIEPTRLYLLEALPRPQSDGAAAPTIGVGPVTLPDYADRPQFVTRSGANEIELAPFARWGAPLGEQVAGVVAENLSALLGKERVTVYPWKAPEELDYRVILAIERFESDRAGNAVLWARWSVLRQGQVAAAGSGRSEITEPAEGGGYASLAAAHSRTLQTLSREIASVIEQHIR